MRFIEEESMRFIEEESMRFIEEESRIEQVFMSELRWVIVKCRSGW
jgi:hypothetical protein